jgi:quercetin dioxygenase-like cupin family protein
MTAEVAARGEGPGTRTPRAYWFLRDLVIVHVSGDETEGRFGLVEFLMPPGDMTPLHVHRGESQTTCVLDGEVTIWLPGGVSRVLRPGDSTHQAPGVPQTERVTSAEPARVLDIGSPAGFEQFVAAVGEPAPELTLPPADRRLPDIEQLALMAAEHGIELLGPPGALP